MKEPSINKILSLIDLDNNNLIVKDYWEADLCAIGIMNKSNPNRLVYISTYGKKADFYDYEVEVKDEINSEGFMSIESCENVDFETLLKVIIRHLSFSK